MWNLGALLLSVGGVYPVHAVLVVVHRRKFI
jgi:hypothetical protein